MTELLERDAVETVTAGKIPNLFKLEYSRIDHIAVAVKDLNSAKEFYCNILGFELKEERLTQGERSGMISAVVSSQSFDIVLIQGLESESQVSRYIDKYGPGVQHVALHVDCIEEAVAELSKKGLEFATSILSDTSLKQAFTRRDPNSGMMIELIQRGEGKGFSDKNVSNLFNQLESADLV